MLAVKEENSSENNEIIDSADIETFKTEMPEPTDDKPLSPIIVPDNLKKPKIRIKKLKIIIALFVLATLIMGALGYVYYKNASVVKTVELPKETIKNILNSTPERPDDNASSLYESERTVWGLYDLLQAEYASDTTKVEMTSTNAVASPLYQPEGIGYYVYGYPKVGLQVTNINSSEGSWGKFIDLVDNYIVDYLTSLGYVKSESDGRKFYMASKSICTLTNAFDEMPVYLSCADLADYKLADGFSTVEDESDLITARETIAASYNLVKAINTPWQMSVDSDLKTTYGPVYKPTGSSYYVVANKSATLKVSGIENYIGITAKEWVALMSPIVSNLDIFFKKHNIQKITNVSDFGELARYNSATVLCSLNNYTQLLYLTCADIADYHSVAIAAAPFVQILADKDGSEALAGVYSMPTIRDSKTIGYQIATINLSSLDGVSGIRNFFYKKDNLNWQYFTSAQQKLYCSDYSTDELRAAYAGETCYDHINKKETTVK